MDETEEEAAHFKEVVRKILRRIPPQKTQDHVMDQVVSWVPDRHVLEQSTICSKDEIRPGPDLLSIPPNAPYVPILQPRLTLWDEVQAHVLYPRRRKLAHNGITPWCAFLLCKIGIEVAGQQDIGPII